MSFAAETEFCLNFLKKVDSTKNSTIFSPASLLNSLAIIYVGSDKTTADEIAKVIGKDTDKEQIINYYSELSHKLNECDERMSDQTEEEKDPDDEEEKYDSNDISDDDGQEDEEHGEEEEEEDDNYYQEEDLNDKTPFFKVINVNGLFVNENLQLQPNFEKIVTESFFIQMQKVDFKDNQTSEIINNYVKDLTNGKIDKIIEKKNLRQDTSCALINAIYFIGKWYNSFKPRFKGIFYSNSGQREMDFMSENLYYLNFTEGKMWEACGIPYKGNKYWMFIVLPKKDECNLNELIAAMDFSMFKEWTTRKHAGLNLTLPLFEISCDFDLSETLSTLGMHDLFSPQGCNLSQMFLTPHKIDKSLHKAVIKVNEFGTEASAATYNAMVPRSGNSPKKFVVDRPFLYFIVSMDDNEKVKNILFSGTFL